MLSGNGYGINHYGRPPSRYDSHGQIDINGNDELIGTATLEGWSGDGTSSNPYIIEDYIFDQISFPITLEDIDLHLTIRDCLIKNSTRAIRSDRCQNITIEGTEITTGGISIDNSMNIKFSNSECSGNFDIDDSKNITITGCTGEGGGAVMSSWNCEDIVIKDSTFSNFTHFGSFYFSSNILLVNSSFDNITDNCFFMVGGDNVRIDGSRFTNFTRNVFDSTGPMKNLTIVNSEFENIGSYGIQLKAEKPIIVNNTLKDMYTGITLGNVIDMEMHNNRFENSGIFIQYLYEDLFQCNISNNNTIDGKPVLFIKDTDYGGLEFSSDFSMLILSNVSNITIRNEIVDHPGTGLLIYSCENIDIDTNSFVDMHTAILSENTNEIQLMDNSILGSIRGAVEFDGCSNLSVMGNILSGSINDGIDVRRSKDVIIEDNDLSDLRWSIYARSNENMVVSENQISNCEYGVRSADNSASTLENNRIVNCTTGIQSDEGFKILIHENEIMYCIWGIHLRDDYGNSNIIQISDNDIRSNKGDGIVIEDYVEAEFYSNTMEFSGFRVRSNLNDLVIPENNTVNGEKILFLDEISKLDIDEEEFSQIIILNSDNISIMGLSLENVSSPVQLYGSESISVNDITINKSINGIYIESVIDLEMDNISISDCTEYGVNLRDCSKVDLKRSEICNVDTGIYIVYLEDILMEGVNISGCTYGFQIFETFSNVTVRSSILRNIGEAGFDIHRTYALVVSDNLFINCSMGIYQRLFCRNIKIVCNLFFENPDYAIMFDEDHDRETVFIHSNMFFYNNGSGVSYDPLFRQVFCEDDGVRWDWDRVGNFWSDWRGPDDNNNGIVDYPFEIEDGILDRYPLSDPPMILVFPPEDLFGKTGNGFVNLSWTGEKKDLIGNETSIVVYRKYGSLDFEEVAVVPPGSAHYNDTDVVNGGVYTYHISARTSLGESTPTKDVIFVPDGIPPILGIIEPVNGTYLNSSSITVRWNAEDPETGLRDVYLRMDDGIWFSVLEDDCFNFTLLADGAHVIYLRAEDRTGNDIEISSQFYVDTTPPVINISSSDGKDFTNGKGFKIEWNCTDLLSGMDHCLFSIDNGTRSVIEAEGSHELGEIEHGWHNAAIEAFDNAGNYNHGKFDFFVDREAPELLIIQPTRSGYIRDPSVRFEWYHWDNYTGIAAIIGSVNGVEKWNSTWQTTFVDLTLEEGENDIMITAFDGAGNNFSRMLYLIVDSIAPTVIEKSPEGTGVNVSRKIIVTFSEQMKSNTAIIECDFNYTRSWLENTLILTPSQTFEKVTNYSISIKATDLAGNPVHVSWTFETEEPEPEIVDEPKEKEDTNYLPVVLISLLIITITIGIVVFIMMRRKDEEPVEYLPSEIDEE